MFNLERWIEIYQSIRKNKLRAVLSGFTVSLGILLFIILFGLGEGLKNSYKDLFLNEANNLVLSRSQFMFPCIKYVKINCLGSVLTELLKIDSKHQGFKHF